jgi:membrane-bound lytic murein transglycosylase D
MMSRTMTFTLLAARWRRNLQRCAQHCTAVTCALLLSACSTTMFAPAPIATVPPETVRAPLEFALIKLPALTAGESQGEFAEVVIPVESNLWSRVRRGFAMAAMEGAAVQQYELWYANRPDYIKRFVERGQRYLYHIVEEVERRNLPSEIVLLPIIESAFNPQANSSASAAGMWQFIPSTGKYFGLSQDWLTDNRRDVLLSTNAALDYLTKLYGMFNSWELAFAAYNCGEGCVGRAVARNQRLGLPTNFASLNLPNETRDYVPKLIAVKNIILSPQSYGVKLPAVENRPFFTQVKAPAKIDVKLAARLAEMGEEQFAQLNPASNKPIAASGTGYLLVPTENADTFRENLELYQSLNAPMVSWVTVTAKRGESVDAVARRHGMTASYLRATYGPFTERKGKFTQPATFLAPSSRNAQAINVAFNKKVQLKREQQNSAPNDGDDGVQLKTRSERDPLRLASLERGSGVGGVVATQPTVASTITKPVTPTIEAATTTYRVEKGDTLFSIAKRSGMTLESLKQINRLTSNVVAIGQMLQLRQEKIATATAATVDNANPAVTSTIATVADVAPVTSASTSAATTAATIASASSMIAPNPAVAAPSPAVAASVAVVQTTPTAAPIEPTAMTTRAAARAVPKPAARFHLVRVGDTLFSLAKRFNTSVDALRSLNRMSANAVLKVGMKLKVAG